MSFLSSADYEEPRCVLCKPTDITPIPTRRVLDKLDEYLNTKDYAAAERHLKYWLTEAEIGGDARGKLTVLNEQIGLYRKVDKPAEGLQAIEAALALAEQFSGTITYGTTLVNAATAYKAFGKAADALPLYEKAETVYESTLPPTDGRLGGLYNNMALTVMELGDYAKAETLFQKALAIMAEQENGEIEMAITYCNLADLASAQLGTDGEKQIETYLDKAEALLDTPTLPHDGYYAFVCEKCAPTFGYYGYFLTEQKLTKQAETIYERT